LSRAVAVLWLLVCCLVLGASLWLYAPGPQSDAIVLFAWAMLALSFPTGLAVSIVVSVVLFAADAANLADGIHVPVWLGLPLVWLAFCAAGYFQWFVAIPWLWRRYRSATAKTGPISTSTATRSSDA
jgi:hypothetical protein